MPVGMDNIEHVVVLMMENRSLDNLLGWVYSNTNNQPPYNLPPQSPPTYEGLVTGKYCNKGPQIHPGVVCAGEPTAPWPPYNNAYLVPDPDPGELFDQMTRQIFGTSTPQPSAQANMSGFLLDYTDQSGPTTAAQIMQSYSPQQASVISQLARNFALCDHWYASAPCQTWPNRGFVHTGSSDGHINNDDSELYDIETIFNVMSDQGISWGVYHDTLYTPSLTHLQFVKLDVHPFHFHPFTVFKTLCSAPAGAPADQKIPTYSFLEPRFLTEYWVNGVHPPEDYHPPHNVCISERFLADAYATVRQSPYRDKILLVITFDEHGGCYDHVPPPAGATAPQPGPVSRYGNFHFDRFGVRVPTILVSSYTQPGTVFRSAGNTPYDHTSILATLRQWQNMTASGKAAFLPSPRITNAPTLYPILTLSDTNKNTNWPSITPNCNPGAYSDEVILNQPLNDLQMSILLAVAQKRNNRQPLPRAMVELMKQRLKTHQDAIDFLAPERLLAELPDEFFRL